MTRNRMAGYDLFVKLGNMFGGDFPSGEIFNALEKCNYDEDKALNYIIENSDSLPLPVTVKRTITSIGGARISAEIKEEAVDSSLKDGVGIVREEEFGVKGDTEDAKMEIVEETCQESQVADSFDGSKVILGADEGSMEMMESINELNVIDVEERKLQIVEEAHLESQKGESFDRSREILDRGDRSMEMEQPADESRVIDVDVEVEIVQETPAECQNVEWTDGSVVILEVKKESECKLGVSEERVEVDQSLAGSKVVVWDDREIRSIEETAKECQKAELVDRSKLILEVKEESDDNFALNEESMKSAEGPNAIVQVKEERDYDIVMLAETLEMEPLKAMAEVRNNFSFEEKVTVMHEKEKARDGCLISKIKEERALGNGESKGMELIKTEVKLESNLQFRSKSSVKQDVVYSADSLTKLSTRDDLKERYQEGLRSQSQYAVQEGKLRDGSDGNMVKAVIVKKESAGEQKVRPSGLEDGDFSVEPDWLLVGGSVVTANSTTKGRKLEDNEIVYFNFPKDSSRKNSKASSKAAAAASGIVRFSTKRSGEIGRLPMEWSNCLIPLVRSSKAKVLGRCIAAPANLSLMQEIMLYLSFYIHRSVFTKDGRFSWRLDTHSNIDSTLNPLLTLFRLLDVKPFQKAEFTPEELDSRKRPLDGDGSLTEGAAALSMAKRRKNCPQVAENKDEQAISEAALNKLVGSINVCNLEEMEPPKTLMCKLKPYQKEALYWMSNLESVDDVSKTLHPCWAAYRVGNEKPIYVNIFSGEATTKMPTATESARGGILADAMGLGKTVMTIALILARPGRGIPDDEKCTPYTNQSRRKGGTLIICPMALLSQWKDELETHCNPDSLSVFVHYGGDRTDDPRMMAKHDVVLTTYGVLSAAYKSGDVKSIYHCIDWHRVVLDEAHTIKAWKTQGAQAAFALSSHSRWCLTGTPLQNNLDDLYSLLCFLKVEPWCNFQCWKNEIQRPYQSGDPRGLAWIKAILKTVMLRRTKDSKDRQGRPILELPPTDIKTVICEQSEAEHDFYNALFKRSKVQFDQFVAQGKVLNNYANILELLLRLRQCCNHPFLVMSRSDSQKYADLDKLARRFLESNLESAAQTLPSAAYVEEVVEGIRRGENTECPICLESADDPVLTPCAHQMCRECLLSSWRTPLSGKCPICRKELKKTDLITCPSESRFRFNVDEKWRESSKVSMLLDYLESIQRSGSGEKSIVFSQWTSFLDLLEIPLRRRGIKFLRFEGKLPQKSRERVLHEFNETQEKMVFLMSLKAGGVGLNLTAASNVFLMDPWWNPAVEEQAIMRIHRIGQKRTVTVRRFIVKDTVEERLQQVQARKQRMIAGALTDGEVRSARIEELKMLFR